MASRRGPTCGRGREATADPAAVTSNDQGGEAGIFIRYSGVQIPKIVSILPFHPAGQVHRWNNYCQRTERRQAKAAGSDAPATKRFCEPLSGCPCLLLGKKEPGPSHLLPVFIVQHDVIPPLPGRKRDVAKDSGSIFFHEEYFAACLQRYLQGLTALFSIPFLN